jgi:hypothetical protein
VRGVPDFLASNSRLPNAIRGDMAAQSWTPGDRAATRCRWQRPSPWPEISSPRISPAPARARRASDLKNLPTGVLEARFPLRVNHYGYRRGSGGTGLHRGGDGVTREYETQADGGYVTVWFERTRTKARGLFGGQADTLTRVHVTSGDREPEYRLNVSRRPGGFCRRLIAATARPAPTGHAEHWSGRTGGTGPRRCWFQHRARLARDQDFTLKPLAS